MPSLADIQSEFARALRDPALPAPEALRLEVARGQSRRFNVYRNNMVVSLVDALQAVFPAVHRLVGEEYFAAAARAYVDRHPPDSPVLLCYGRLFGDFLDRLPTASRAPYLGDVARLEWRRASALHAADAVPVGIERLSALVETEMSGARLVLHPSLSWLASRWPVVSLWSASVDPEHAGDVDMGGGEAAAVVRPALRVGVHRMPAGGAAFLEALGRGMTLGQAAQHAATDNKQFELAAQLQFVFQIGAVVAVNPD